MIFTYKAWSKFCKKLADADISAIAAKEVAAERAPYVVLKHDVETDVSHAYEIAVIEQRYGHRGSYYVQAYLLEKEENVDLLRKMQEMGHEISYHYDVMDSNKGDLTAAMSEFEENRRLFEKKGFPVITVCQHGNPIVERVGYTSNRDFFRSPMVQEAYPQISDIMVNFHTSVPTEYRYFSDAGRQFKWIFDPFENDIVNSDDKNIAYENLDILFEALDQKGGNIISTHPHRWMRFALGVVVKDAIFKCVKAAAKVAMNVPFLRKFMEKHYYLAKKF